MRKKPEDKKATGKYASMYMHRHRNVFGKCNF